MVAATVTTNALGQRPEGAPEPPAAIPQPDRVEPAATAEASDYVVRGSSEVAGYGDTDHVFVFTPTIAGSVARPTAGWSVDGRYLVDVVSAASVDIVSTASRRWEEVRHAGTLDATYKPDTFGVTASAAVSSEPDYLSLSGGVLFSQDLLAKNLTLLAGYDHGHDVAGRSGTPFSVFSHDIESDGVKAGATFVIDRATIATAMADAGFERGDSSKPYRYIPLFAPGTSLAAGTSIDTVNATRLPQRVLEQLPLSRNRYALTLRLARRFAASTLRLEERLYDDSWALMATSTDARFLVDVSPRVEIGPHARVHAQKAVDFWQRVYTLNPGLAYPALRTGDRELGPLYTLTGGGTLRIGLGPTYEPMQWAIGIDLNAAYTRYLDDLYVTERLSTVGAVSITGEL